MFPCDTAQPQTSNLNVTGSRPAKANGALVALSDAGQLCVVASVATHVIVDLAGRFAATRQLLFHPVAPVRVLDTSTGRGGWSGRLAPGPVDRRGNAGTRVRRRRRHGDRRRAGRRRLPHHVGRRRAAGRVERERRRAARRSPTWPWPRPAPTATSNCSPATALDSTSSSTSPECSRDPPSCPLCCSHSARSPPCATAVTPPAAHAAPPPPHVDEGLRGRGLDRWR